MIKISDEKREKIKTLRAAGETHLVIAEKVGVSKATVGRVLDGDGQAKPGKNGGAAHLNGSRLAALNEDILSGKFTARQLREKHGISSQSIYKRMGVMRQAPAPDPALQLTTPRMAKDARREVKDSELDRLRAIIGRLATKYPDILQKVL